ncbi:hypothetical protein ARMGADRAFT_1019602 [Armillaria gallica]|uniref:F-box domain-containing protein n=1 Tax=Armillaria gallica TaxID=47427 RepID=A0A2H3D2J0_ARMGA|nr:hypothetical protein ARMGADRAFT_1019602 [Armillaria gallica]
MDLSRDQLSSATTNHRIFHLLCPTLCPLSMMLLEFPNELLQNIAFEADQRSRKRLRQTCKIFRDVCTPLVFMYISLPEDRYTWRGAPESVRLPFITALSSGSELARHIKHLSVEIVERDDLDYAPPSSIKEVKERKRVDDEKIFNRLFVDAIPSMLSLQSLDLSAWGPAPSGNVELMFAQFGDLPRLSKLSLRLSRSWSIPCAQLRHIQDLRYAGPGGDGFLALIGDNHGLEIIDAYISDPRIPELKDGSSIFSLFRSFPPGTYSTVRKLTVGLRRHWSSVGPVNVTLQKYKAPALIPHLRHLQFLHTDFNVPNELWDGLREEGIHLTVLEYVCWRVELSLLSYLGSFTGLKELELQIKGPSEQDGVHLKFFLLNVVIPNAGCLTKVHIKPVMSGNWCLDHPMLDALVMCCHLESLYICSDRARTRLEPRYNVIDRTMALLIDYWPHLSDLTIMTASLGTPTVGSTPKQIHSRVLVARFPYPSIDMLKTEIWTNFGHYSMKIHSRKKKVYTFKIKWLSCYGRKKCQRKWRFWRRSDPSDEE